MFKKKTQSIVSTLNNHFQFVELIKSVVRYFLYFCGVLITWCLALEYSKGDFILLRLRYFEWEAIDKFVYFYSKAPFSRGDAGEFAQIDIGNTAKILIIVFSVLLFIRLFNLLIGWNHNESYLRRVLKPIDDMAMAAEKISRHGIDENRIHNAEDAINSISNSKDTIQIGDEDLKGLETSINNLLFRLKSSYEEQSRFVDDASHELRTPIAVIQGYASMLERWGKDDPQIRDESIHAILEESEHMQTLVEQLLFLARGDGGRQKLNFENVNAASLLSEIRNECELIDPGHIYTFRGEPANISADDGMLKQAIRILTDNAAKYTPEGGNITLGVVKKGDNVLISVQDDGIGIGKEEASHIFERFFRGEDIRGNTSGSGLGLSIAQWIVQHHNGTIEAVGFKDIGTRFTITLKAI